MSKRVKIFEPKFERVVEGRSIREVVKNKKAKLLKHRNVAERTLMTFVNGGEEAILQQRQYIEYSPYSKSELEKLSADRFDEVRRNHFVDLDRIEESIKPKSGAKNTDKAVPSKKNAIIEAILAKQKEFKEVFTVKD